MWSPEPSRCIEQFSAANPDENDIAKLACSTLAIYFSKKLLVGFPTRE